MKVYLAGTISGLNYEEGQGWRSRAKEALLDVGIHGYSPLRAKEYLKNVGTIAHSYDTVNGHDTPFSTERGIMTRDFYDVETSDAVLVYLKEAPRVSIGTVMEIAWAWHLRIPVVLVAEKDGLHNHPMLNQAVGYHVETLEEGIEVIKSILLP